MDDSTVIKILSGLVGTFIAFYVKEISAKLSDLNSKIERLIRLEEKSENLDKRITAVENTLNRAA